MLGGGLASAYWFKGFFRTEAGGGFTIIVVLGHLVAGVGGRVRDAGRLAEFASVEAVDGVEDEGGRCGEDHVSRFCALAAVLLFAAIFMIPMLCNANPSLDVARSNRSRKVVVAPHRRFWGRRIGDRDWTI